jgi:hypothetical protein
MLENDVFVKEDDRWLKSSSYDVLNLFGMSSYSINKQNGEPS